MTKNTTNAPIFSAARIARLIAPSPEQALLPTAEQQGVIEHSPEGTTLIVAGAGSGKTETMANRVVWLVANGVVAPENVLGLTFTRKAAGELRERITGRLQTFADRLHDAGERGELTDREVDRARTLHEMLDDGLDIPEVSTYNAFAAGVLSEFGLAAGIAPDATIIDDTTAWGIARDIVIGSRDPALVETDLSIAQLVEYVIRLDHAVSDNLSSLDRVDQVVEEFCRVETLPYNEKVRETGLDGKLYADVRSAIAALRDTPLITRLAREYAAEKRRRNLLEFSDQLALATRTIDGAPAAITALRQRHRVVLLDEVQDTSVGQTRFLSKLFAGRPVMAVGDPHQSIYGWRGASAEGLQRFHLDFSERADAPRATLTLSTSWRNPERVLDAANTIARPLAADAPIDVPSLAARAGAAAGTVDCVYPETLAEEQRLVAEWMREKRREHLHRHGTTPTAAVIFRTRKHMAAFSATLTELGVPNRIVGIGGLLTTPEVTDIVSVMRCLWYADAGSDLIRVLAGPRFAVGVADLAGLRAAARWFEKRDVSQQHLGDADLEADRVLPDPDRRTTLIDALDQLTRVRDETHRAFASISDAGRARMREAGEVLQLLRQGIGGSIAELIADIVHALRIDIELDANAARETAGSSTAHANIDAFIDQVEQFLATDTAATLPALLEWLERATVADDVAEHVAAPSPDTVHLITAHGAKGLEWDLVAVPRLVASEFPAASKEGTGWLRTGHIPDELRGDAASRPALDWRIASTQKELKDRIADYKAQLKERNGEEERRLAYVAITRSARHLLLSGSFWGGQKRPRQPSEYLEELRDAGIIDELPAASACESDPGADTAGGLPWPRDPLGRRREAVLRAAKAVETARARGGEPSENDGVSPLVELLLAEREAHHRGDESRAPLARRITASTFHEFVDDPRTAERQRMRPVPQRPYRKTRIGNRFHEWVERRATTPLGTAMMLDAFDDVDADELAPLIEQFERSRWADRQPIAVELEVGLPFAGRTLVCKLDAVYRTETSDGEFYEVVDWKSGRPPANNEERATRFFQLDLYRHAYAQWAEVEPERISVTLFYVADGIELRGEEPRTLSELETLWLDAASTLGGATALS